MVQLAQDTVVDVTMNVAGVTETVVVSATIVPVIEKDSAAIKSGVSSETIKSLPVGQEYRDRSSSFPACSTRRTRFAGRALAAAARTTSTSSTE
jgi:hypothetical protein